ncbi:MAG: type II secretion system F family protein [Candidatus Paceibacterota bacterium]|jgi:type IV pilus assembly protein PilC
MKFKFKAIKKNGDKYIGTKESNDKFSLYEELKSEGNTLISASEITKSRFEIDLPFINSVPEHQKIIFAKNLGLMIKAGLPLAKGLDILEKQITNKRFKKIIELLQAEIRKGNPLSEACSAYPEVFPKLFVSMVRAGEESGKLSESLQIVANQMDGSYKLKEKIKGAMVYPGVIVSIMIIIGVLMLVYVVPGITATFKDLKVELPLLTRILINTSDFLKNNILLCLFAVILIIISFYFFIRSKPGKRVFDLVVLKLPVIGDLVRETNSARITRTISSLLSSGVAYAEAISITRDVVQNEYFKDVLTTAISTVEKGGTISSVFMKNVKLCPIFVTEMMVVGEETGSLPSTLMEVATFYEESIDQKTKNMSTIIEPVLMVIIGVAVGFFALAMIKPIYSLMDSI